jgi:DNA-binding NtrC family response regulator
MKLFGKRLLFVEDETRIHETFSLILLQYGFTVALASTVQEALVQIRNQEFDLLVCDLNIEHERDGYTVVRAMREVNPNCVTIVLTGHPDMESAEEGIRLGIEEYIAKPADADTLVALLAEKLAARKKPQATI